MIQTPFGSPNPKAVPQARPSAARPRERLSPTATYRTRRQLGRHPSPFAMAGLRPIEFGRSLIDGRKDETSAAARLRPGGEARVPRPQPPAIVDDHGQPQARLLEARDGDRRHSPDHLAASGMEASARVAPRALCGRGARSKVRDRHESSSWQTRCSSMPPTRKRRGWWWSAARRSRSSTSNRPLGGSCAATSISRRSRGSNRRCRPPSSSTAATATASSPSARSIPTTTRSRSPTGRRCSRRTPAPSARRSTRRSGDATAATAAGATPRAALRAASRSTGRPRPTPTSPSALAGRAA